MERPGSSPGATIRALRRPARPLGTRPTEPPPPRGLICVEPQPYVDFLGLVADARLVLTDSGGLQEETTYLGIPCLTMRENTERPITVTMGTNKLVDARTLAGNLELILDGQWQTGQCPPLWDGKTATRAVACLEARTRAL